MYVYIYIYICCILPTHLTDFVTGGFAFSGVLEDNGEEASRIDEHAVTLGNAYLFADSGDIRLAGVTNHHGGVGVGVRLETSLSVRGGNGI